MSSPPSQPARPPQQPPLFISYVTGSRPSGQWTRVSREVIDLEPSISSEAGAAISFRRIEGTGGSSEERRAVGSGEATRREGRVSGNTRLGDSVLARNAAPAVPVPQPTTIAKMPSFPRSKESTLRNLWNDVTSSTPNSRKQTPEQLLKGIIVDYLAHERFPGTVGTLLGLHPPTTEGNGKGKARDGEGEEEEDVQMMESSSGLSIGSERKAHAEMLIRQIEWRKEIREMILSGQISLATSLIREHFPSLLDTTRDAPTSRSEDDEDDEMEEDDEETITIGETYTRRQIYAPAKRKSEPGSEAAGTGTGDSRAYTSRRLPHVNAFVAGPSGVSRVSSRTGTTGSNGNGTAAATTGTAGDVQWTAHPRTTGSANTSNSSQTVQSSDAPTVPDFPYARTYDRPTFLALNLDIQEFVEGLRVLQTQGVSSPSEATSLSNSLYEEPPTNGHTTNSLLAPQTNTSAKQTRDALILASLSHASRLDSTARALPAREARKYAPQIQDVCGLLAYTDMESSPLAGYLEQGRRVRLAEMVEGCILASIGYPPNSILETLWQQNTYLWHPEIGYLAAEGVSFGDGEDGDGEGDEGKKMRELAMDLLYDEPLGLS